MKDLSLVEFGKMVPFLCSKETSSNPETWNSANPTHGHCAVISVLAQDYFGGDIVKVSLKDTPYSYLKSHFFNIIEGKEIDFTIQQFTDSFSYRDAQREEQNKEEVLAYPGSKARYEILKHKLNL